MLPSDVPRHFANGRHRSRSVVTVAVNGQQLQSLRLQAGLTQEELARKSGYSDRLIRKAEASGLLRRSTIAHLTAALSTCDRKVNADDLMFSRESLTREVFSALLIGTSENTESMFQFLHPELQLSVAGQDLLIPFSGDYTGHLAIESFRTRFAACFTIASESPVEIQIYTAATETCVQCSLPMNHDSRPDPVQVWWFLKVQFENQVIRSLELMYDTGVICRLLDQMSL